MSDDSSSNGLSESLPNDQLRELHQEITALRALLVDFSVDVSRRLEWMERTWSIIYNQLDSIESQIRPM